VKGIQSTTLAASIAALACSGVLLAQAPAPSPASPREQTPAAQSAPTPTTTITGCVYQEKDVPGRSPNPVERAGILEDYILAEVSSGAQSATPGAAGTAGATATAGAAPKLGSMFKLEFVDDEKLKALVGKRVEVTGRVDREAGDSASPAAAAPSTTQADKVVGRDRIDLAELEVASIKEVPGACPSTPASR
jgi:hypothetical protein